MSRFDVLKDKSILLVDDDELTRVAIEKNLKRHAFSFITAKDGLEGLNKFRHNKIDIIITDIHMPHLNGLDMISEIIKLKPTQRFIVITSYDSDENLFESIKKGAISFMKKPILIENLQSALVMAALKFDEKIINLSKNITINLTKEKILKNKKEIYLSKLENSIFWLLCYNLSNLVTYSMIEDYAYDNKSVKIGTIHTAIVRIKKHLEDIKISNIQGIGYKLNPL